MRINVSLGQGELQYIKEMGISPSKLLQTAVKNAMNHKNSEEVEQDYRDFEGKLQRYIKKLQFLYDFIDNRGLKDDLVREENNELRRVYKGTSKNNGIDTGNREIKGANGEPRPETKKLQEQIISELG